MKLNRLSMKLKIIPTFLFSLFILSLSCSSCKKDKDENKGFDLLNTNHLRHLYETIELSGDTNLGIVHIYSEYPDYNFTIEPYEGFTCVDDVARAMRVNFSIPNDITSYEMYSYMPDFLLYMQAPNGYFYNFMWGDYTINKTYQTSVPEPNWWSWRALWALSGYPANYHYTSGRVRQALNKLTENIYNEYLEIPMDIENIEGIEIPAWLPHGTAGDQAGLLIVGLEQYYKNVNKDERALQLIERFADGLLIMQKGDSTTFPHGAYLSWKNIWHAYGNIQAYAMLKAGQLLERDDYIQSALIEIDNFYPYLIEQNYLSHFSIKKNGNEFEILEMEQFPQIAYGFRPMIWASIEAGKITQDAKYIRQAEKIASWFAGDNIANQMMFDPYITGRCYDGIISPGNVNLNSGAESTIEALLTMNQFFTIYEPVVNWSSIYEKH